MGSPNKFPHALVTLCVLMGFALVFAAGARAAYPPDRPSLRIEAGMHTAPITGMAADAAGQYLVTGSVDKTVRIWELRTYKLVTSLRMPLGPGREGEVAAVALSPDGSLIAVAYQAGFAVPLRHEVVLLDRQSGEPRKRLAPQSGRINRLVFSPDGLRIAVATGQGGTRVYSVTREIEIGKDGCTGSGNDADFDKKGRLVTTCDDRRIRLFDAALRLQKSVVSQQAYEAERKAAGMVWPKQIPASIRFSPDGSKLAVTYTGIGNLNAEVLSGRTLDLDPEFRHPSITGILRADWSLDGKIWCLVGGGNVGPLKGEGEWPFRRVEDYQATDFLILPDGGIVENGSGNLEHGIALRFYGARQTLLSEHLHTPLFPHYAAFFEVENSGQLGFWLIPPGDERTGKKMIFSAAEGELTEAGDRQRAPALDRDGDDEYIREMQGRSIRYGRPARSTRPRPATAAQPGGLLVDVDQGKAFLNDRPLPLDQSNQEEALGWNVAPDSRSFVIRTDLALRCFDAAGAQRWIAEVPSVPWRMKLSADGRLLVVAFADRTFRFYSYADGKELIALYLHRDGRWVSWTPSGEYATGAGRDDRLLLGWVRNRGNGGLGIFEPVANGAQPQRPLRAAALWSLLRSGGTPLPLQGPAPAQVPIIRIVSPREGEEITENRLRVELGVRSPSGAAITAVSVFINGREARGIFNVTDGAGSLPAATPVDLAPGETRRVLTIQVPREDFVLSALARTDTAVSAQAMVRVRWRSNAAPQPDPRATLYVLAIGVGAYRHGGLRLRYPAKDAADFVAALKAQEGKLYGRVVVKVLSEESATKDNILSALDWLRRQSTAYSVTMLFMAGHGFTDPANGRYYFLPVDADPNQIMRTMLPEEDIRIVSKLPGKVLLFLDTCFAGRVYGDRQLRAAPDLSRFINELASADNGLVVFTSSTQQQLSQESPEWQNGAFTKALVEGLLGRAASSARAPGSPRAVTVNGLSHFISERVKELTQGLQAPAMARPGTSPDFPIAVVP